MYNTIQAFSGVRVDLLNPKPEQICIEDIAHPLSLQCRFNGHCKRFYSVAEHCIRVAWAVEDEFVPWALLHDGGEAYVSDVVTPLKKLLPEFQAAENRMLKAIARKFGLTLPIPKEVHKMDSHLLMTERRDLMGPVTQRWRVEVDPLPGPIIPMTPEQAESAFLALAEAVL